MYFRNARRGATLLFFAAGLAVTTRAQTFSPSGTTTISVAVSAEAALSVGTATTSLTPAAGQFANYTGSTALTYKIRTTKTGGTGTITAQVTADFVGNGPSVANSGTTGDTLSYSCTVASPGTACGTSQTASTTSSTSIGTFGANAHSAKAGSSASVAWTLINDPAYETGTYTATVTFTISAT